MPTVQRDPVTQKTLRDPTTQKCVLAGPEGAAIPSCCCGCIACRPCCPDCLFIKFNGDWPASSVDHFPPGNMDDVSRFLRNGGNPWKLKRNGDGCTFSLFCEINEDFDSPAIHYVRLYLTAFAYISNAGFLTIGFFGFIAPDFDSLGTRVIYIEPGDDFTSAEEAGCAGVVHMLPREGIGGGDPPPDAVMDLYYGFAEDCDATNEECLSDPSCETCCPDVTCFHLTGSITLHPLGGGDPIVLDYDFPCTRNSEPGFSSCFYFGQCNNEFDSGVKYAATIHVVCDDDGTPQIWHFGIQDYRYHIGIIAGLTNPDDPTAVEVGCDSAAHITSGYLFGTHIYKSADVDITLEPLHECEHVDHCTEPIHPDDCPDDCFECDGCELVCLTDSVLSIHYNIFPGECGDCTNSGIDGCGQCCDEPLVFTTGERIPSCASHVVGSPEECTGNGWYWYCKDDCVEPGGGTGSPCSRIDIEGDLELEFASVVGTEAHWSASLDFGGTVGVVNFDVWFDCSTGRWYARIAYKSGRCVASGDINGNCDSFTSINLNTKDVVTNHTCAGTGGLSFTSIEYADFSCPEAA